MERRFEHNFANLAERLTQRMDTLTDVVARESNLWMLDMMTHLYLVGLRTDTAALTRAMSSSSESFIIIWIGVL